MVAKDSLRPFIVDACRKMKVEVLGTEFNVQAYPEDEELRTTLNRGKVRIGIGGGAFGVVIRTSRLYVHVGT